MPIDIELVATPGMAILESGTYPATVTSIEPDDGQYGAQLRFEFTVDGQRDENSNPITLLAWASQKLSPQSKLWAWWVALTGKPPEVGATHKSSTLIGKKCRLVIEEVETDNGPRSRVKAVWAPAAKAEVTANCKECGAEPQYFDADGAGYCDAHGPRGRKP